MSDLDVPEPYTNRTADDVKADPRLGDRASVLYDETRYDAAVIEGDDNTELRLLLREEVYYVSPWMRDSKTVPIPRCIALDPRVGDTVRFPTGASEEVVGVGDEYVHVISREGLAGIHPRRAWELGASSWAACFDRAGGARFDPQPGDFAFTCRGVDGWSTCRVVGRDGGSITLADGRSVTLQVWSSAADGLFPTRYDCTCRVPK